MARAHTQSILAIKIEITANMSYNSYCTPLLHDKRNLLYGELLKNIVHKLTVYLLFDTMEYTVLYV